jgi:hypothetical protein
MSYDRIPDILLPYKEDLFHFAPIPFVYHLVEDSDLGAWHKDLISEARRAMPEPVLEVPDVRHVKDMGKPFNFPQPTWSEQHLPAIGVWHQVPTNAFLKLEVAPVQRLRRLIESRYLNALKLLGAKKPLEARIRESWIQFYKASDYKVLHNHEGYMGPPWENSWAGAYYLDDGDPDPSMPYAGILSFRVRNANYLFRPRPGLLLLWPSDVLHEVHPFYGSRERVVINFNLYTGDR